MLKYAKTTSDSWYISHFLVKFGLRISFTESGVKSTRWIFCHWRPDVVKEIQVLKFGPVMLGRTGGERNIKKKPVVGSVPQVTSPDGVQVQVQLCQFTARLRYGVAAQRLAATAARQRWRPEPLTHDRSAATRRPRHWHHGRSI